MTSVDVLGLALSLSMDAVAVALALGCGRPAPGVRAPLRLAACFGLAQSLTVVLGWLSGSALRAPLAGGAAWVAFGLLTARGTKMVLDAVRRRDVSVVAADPYSGWALLTLSAATSLDGLVVGVPLGPLGVRIGWPAAVIGGVVAVCTFVAVLVGRHVGVAWGRRAELAGGFGLCAVGTKILITAVAR